jgi:hypothetical protein
VFLSVFQSIRLRNIPAYSILFVIVAVDPGARRIAGITESNRMELAPYLACRIGHLDPIWQPLIGSSCHLFRIVILFHHCLRTQWRRLVGRPPCLPAFQAI